MIRSRYRSRGGGAGGGVVPSNLSAPTINDQFFVNETMSATSSGVWDGGTILEYEYRWYLDGVLTGETGYARDGLNQISEDGDLVKLEVRARNAAGWSEWVESNTHYIIRLVLLHDASDTSPTNIVQSGGSVSQWNDKSGEGFHSTQGTGANQFISETRTINGLNALDADGANDFMNCSVNLHAVLNSPHTVFGVGQSDVTTGTKCLIYGITGASGSWGLLQPFNSSNQSGFRVGTGGFSTVAVTPNTGQHFLMGERTTSANYQGSLDGTNGTANTNGSNPSVNAITIGVLTSDFSTAFNGLIGVIGIAPRVLNSTEKSQIRNRYKSIWGTP